jgi:hypothetical protein
MHADSIAARVSRILETLPPGVTLAAAAEGRTPAVGANFIRIGTRIFGRQPEKT